MAWFRFSIATTVPLLCLLITSAAQAQYVVPESRIESVRGIALGSGIRASAVGTHAQADNPANLVRGGLYHLEAFAQYDPTYQFTGVGASVVDSMTSNLAAGFSVRGVLGDNEAGEHSGFDGRLGLAYPVVEALSLGLAFRYARLEVANPDALDEDPDPDQVDHLYRLKHFTMDAAATLQLGMVSIAALGLNLVDTGSALAPTQAGGSLAVSVSEMVTLGGDLLVDVRSFDSPKLLGGGAMELLLADSFPLRGGYRYDHGRDRHAVTAGLGYVDQILGLQIGFRQHLGAVPETNLIFSFQYFVR